MTNIHFNELTFSGDDASMNHFKEKIFEVIKNDSEKTIQDLLEKEFEDPDEVYKRLGYQTDCPDDSHIGCFGFQFDSKSVLIEFCSYNEAPENFDYVSDLCVRYQLDCEMKSSCAGYDSFDILHFYKNGKSTIKFGDYLRGLYENPKFEFDFDKELAADLFYDLFNKNVKPDIWDEYSEKYYFVNEKDRRNMKKKVDFIVRLVQNKGI